MTKKSPTVRATRLTITLTVWEEGGEWRSEADACELTSVDREGDGDQCVGDGYGSTTANGAALNAVQSALSGTLRDERMRDTVLPSDALDLMFGLSTLFGEPDFDIGPHDPREVVKKFNARWARWSRAAELAAELLNGLAGEMSDDPHGYSLDELAHLVGSEQE